MSNTVIIALPTLCSPSPYDPIAIPIALWRRNKLASGTGSLARYFPLWTVLSLAVAG